MHLLAILFFVLVAIGIRSQEKWLDRDLSETKWTQRWYRTLFCFCFPGLLLPIAAIAVLYMGCHGQMLGIKAGMAGCVISGSLLIFALVCWLKLFYQGDRSVRRLKNYPQQIVAGTTVRIVGLDLPYSAQIGFWHPELVMSKGLLESLDEQHLAAVIAHEQAHVTYRDTFWFFWLGWIRAFSFWLPYTETLWQELLLLRELRADRLAAKSVDFLLLAESLLTVAKTPLECPNCCVSLNDARIGDRLSERIEALLDPDMSIPAASWRNWSWLCLLSLPLLTIPLHY